LVTGKFDAKLFNQFNNNFAYYNYPTNGYNQTYAYPVAPLWPHAIAMN
jgi:hypothetical protein